MLEHTFTLATFTDAKLEAANFCESDEVRQWMREQEKAFGGTVTVKEHDYWIDGLSLRIHILFNLDMELQPPTL